MNSEKSCGTAAQSEQGDQFIFILSSQETHIAPRYKVVQAKKTSRNTYLYPLFPPSALLFGLQCPT